MCCVASGLLIEHMRFECCSLFVTFSFEDRTARLYHIYVISYVLTAKKEEEEETIVKHTFKYT